MSNNTEIISSDEESIHEYDSDSCNEETPVETTPVKKTKQTFEEFVEQHLKDFNDFKSEMDEISMKDFYKTFNKFVKSQEVFMSKIIKMQKKSGTKKKRKNAENTGKSGFNKPTKLPKAFSKYLDIDEDTEMTRPQLVKQLNKKFAEDGFKNDGEICISSKKISKILDVDKDHTFHAKDYHKFIASYYNKEKTI